MRVKKPLSLFGDVESDDDPDAPRGLGYAEIMLGESADLDTRAGIEDADLRLRAMASREVARPEWAAVDPRARRAYVSLYGRAAAPTHKLTPFERQAVAIAIGGGPTAIDHDAGEREAIEWP